MENTPKKKKGWLKLLAAFLAGAVVVAIVIMATTGSLFAGNIFRYGGTKVSDTMTVPEAVKTLCTKTPCDVEKALTQQITNLDQRFEDFKTEMRSYNFSHRVDNLETAMNNKLDYSTFTSANLTGKFNMLKQNFLSHVHTQLNTHPSGSFSWW